MDILQNQAFQDPIQDTKNHSEFISICLNLIIQSPTSEIKAIHAKTLYDYMTVPAFNYVMDRPLFKCMTIKKAYDLKMQCYDLLELTNSLNCFLTAFGSPLNEVDEVDIDNVEVEL